MWETVDFLLFLSFCWRDLVPRGNVSCDLLLRFAFHVRVSAWAGFGANEDGDWAELHRERLGGGNREKGAGKWSGRAERSELHAFTPSRASLLLQHHLT